MTPHLLFGASPHPYSYGNQHVQSRIADGIKLIPIIPTTDPIAPTCILSVTHSGVFSPGKLDV
jgi:hypothetical protein